jgi:hypothetical protein
MSWLLPMRGWQLTPNILAGKMVVRAPEWAFSRRGAPPTNRSSTKTAASPALRALALAHATLAFQTAQ